MSERRPRVVPLQIQLSTLVHRSVATLYSHLVTRQTGAAIRVGIERQIGEMDGLCLSVLDFAHVVVLDYSCADEIIAKLLRLYHAAPAADGAYFLARTVGESHRETIDAVLRRHRLALAARLEDGSPALLGAAAPMECDVWAALNRLGRASAGRVALEAGRPEPETAATLRALCARRVALRELAKADNNHSGEEFAALTGLVD